MHFGATDTDNNHTLQHIQDGTPGPDVRALVLPD